MYYLNDKHSQYEYTIYVRYGTALPYMIGRTFTNYWDTCRYLMDIAKRHQRFGHICYIDDDFFYNEYERDLKGTYYKILRRPVSDWEELDEREVA